MSITDECFPSDPGSVLVGLAVISILRCVAVRGFNHTGAASIQTWSVLLILSYSQDWKHKTSD